MQIEEKRKVKNARLSRGLKKELDVKVTNEAATKRLERHIPGLAKVATIKAYRRALASGSKVLIAEAGHLKEISPGGEVRIIRQIESPVKMRKGQIIEIE